ncbi:MAG TPA: hypothetical protein VG269_12950 [Tepidisphaeraceae bacterium]|jgi:hypothetical protein|nr:hypothetical protein [Tepidisphaeraceae bacterium]
MPMQCARRITLIVLVTCAPLFLCACESKSRDFVGESAARVLAAPDRVEAFRVAGTRGAPATSEPADRAGNLAGFPITATGRNQGRDFGTRLGAVLLDDKSYEWQMAKGCIFDPGVAFRVWRGQESVIVLICFKCEEVGIAPDDEIKNLHIKDADPGIPALRRLAQEAFPDDVEIQQLK